MPTVQGVGEERLRSLGLLDQVLEDGDLVANRFAPLLVGCVEDRARGVQRDAETVGDLDERQAT